MKIEFFEKAVHAIKNDVYQNIHSILIGDKAVRLLEFYAQEHDAQTLHEAQSITKSIQAILIGIALDKKWLKDLNTPIKNYFSAIKDINWQKPKDQITLFHLLQMTAGFQWNEGEMSYNDFDNSSTHLHLSQDWVHFALSQEMQCPPSQVFSYSSGYLILTSYILREVTNMPNSLFAQKYLYEPLNITDFEYFCSPADREILSDVSLTSRSLLKIGQLVLQKGSWEGKQIVSENWIKLMTTPQIKVGEHQQYGYFWWHTTFDFAGGKIPAVYAWGYGGQHIFLFPSLQKVIVFTAGLYQRWLPNLAPEPFEIVQQYLLKMWE